MDNRGRDGSCEPPPAQTYEEDPLFEDVIFDGPAPRDLSANHDEYLYEKK